jgi:glycosyltransferase involved in cell wall biosynthesis
MFVIGLQLPFHGAVWRRIEFFARYLALRGFETYVLSPRTFYFACHGFNKEKRTQISYPFKLFVIPFKLHLCKSPFLTSLLEVINSIFMGVLILIFKPKVVILSIPPFHYIPGIYIFSRLSKAKIIIDIRDPLDNTFTRYKKFKFINFIRKLYYAILYKSDAILVVSRSMIHDLVKIIQPLSQKIYLIRNGADLRMFKPIYELNVKETNEFKIFFMGRSIEGYNISIVLKALSKLKEQGFNVYLYIAGTIDPIILVEAKNLGVLGNIKYLGVLSTEELVKMMAEMDLAILPYYNDKRYKYSLPTKFYEYIASGLPVLVIAPSYFEIVEIVKENEIGVWCPVDNETCVILTIKQLYSNRQALLKLKEKCLMFRNNIDRGRFAEELLGIILKMLQRA